MGAEISRYLTLCYFYPDSTNLGRQTRYHLSLNYLVYDTAFQLLPPNDSLLDPTFWVCLVSQCQSVMQHNLRSLLLSLLLCLLLPFFSMLLLLLLLLHLMSMSLLHSPFPHIPSPPSSSFHVSHLPHVPPLVHTPFLLLLMLGCCHVLEKLVDSL